MEVGVGERARPLDRGDRAGLTGGNIALARTAPVKRRDGSHEHAQHLGHKGWITEQAEPQRAGERERPLPVVGAMWKDVVDQMCCAVGHPPAIARRAQSAGLAAERDEHLVVARWTANAREAAFDDAAVEVPAKAILDVPWQAEAVGRSVAGILQHGLEVVGDHPIERGRLRLSRPIAFRQRRGRRARAVFVDVLGLVRSGHRRRSACSMPPLFSRSLRDDSRRCRCYVRWPDTWWPHTGRHGKAGDHHGLREPAGRGRTRPTRCASSRIRACCSRRSTCRRA